MNCWRGTYCRPNMPHQNHHTAPHLNHYVCTVRFSEETSSFAARSFLFLFCFSHTSVLKRLLNISQLHSKPTLKSIAFRYMITVKPFGGEMQLTTKQCLTIRKFHIWALISPKLSYFKKETCPKKLKNMGTNMLLSWKTHFFEPSAHF